ncbi:MAG: RNA-directed DNA polymerase, partial [Candidatus Pacebacteria bacterium]|nr:RNA-directed DNA polymerase [Candidatus Paceibacterota bacterium]
MTSQFFANIYLNRLDQFVKHDLGVKFYLRYVDDFILIGKNPRQLQIWKKRIDIFLKKELQLTLHPRKSVQQSVCRGINFVGFIIKPGYSLIRRRVVNHLKEKLKKFNDSPLPDSPETFQKDLQNILSVINSYYGQFRHADTVRLRKSLYTRHFGVLKSYLEPSSLDFYYFRVK